MADGGGRFTAALEALDGVEAGRLALESGATAAAGRRTRRGTSCGSDVLLAAQDRPYRAESRCSGSTCTMTFKDESVTVDLREIDPSGSTMTIADRQLRNGVETGKPEPRVTGWG